jgi:hypothetical protein
MSDRPGAVPAARWAVGVTARALPRQADRERYRREFVAELHGCGPANRPGTSPG